MAITAALRYAGKNRLRYLITSSAGEGEAVVIESDGGVTPDLLTDARAAAAVPLIKIIRAGEDGYGKIVAQTLLTQAQGRALFASDDSASVVGIGMPVAMMWVTPRLSSGVFPFIVDVIAGQTDPNTVGVQVTAGSSGAAYLDIFIPGPIGA